MKDLLNHSPSELLQNGVSTRNTGDLDTAELLLTAARIVAPTHWQPSYELGVLYEARGWLTAAKAAYELAFSLDRRVTRSFERLVALMGVSNDADGAERVYRAAECGPGAIPIGTLRASVGFVDFVRSNPIARARSEHSEFLIQHGGFRNADVLVNEMVRRADQGEPYALVRLGDGEGAWLFRSSEAEARYGALLDRNREEFLRIWYGDLSAGARDEFWRVTGWIRSNLKMADVIGVPPVTWIEHEWNIASLRGYAGTLNALRTAQTSGAETCELAVQTIHFELDEGDRMHRLLGGRSTVGIVSNNPALREFVRERFGVRSVIHIPIPGEPSRRHLLGEDAIYGTHFPDRYAEIVSSLASADYSGVPFLVAGGILGKAYALRLKAAGAVAVDIGSVADKWLNRPTRPQFAG